MYAVNVTSPVQLHLVSGCRNSGAENKEQFWVVVEESIPIFLVSRDPIGSNKRIRKNNQVFLYFTPAKTNLLLQL